MKHLMLLLCLLWLAAVIIGAENKSDSAIQTAVEKLINQKKYSPGSLGLAVKDLSHDTVLVAVHADSMFNPASVTKLLTAAIAYEKLGLNFLFVTRIYTDTILRNDSAVTVHNLYLQGSGDPGFTAERLYLFVEHLYHCGIRTIAGDLVLDDYFFDSVTVGPGFDEDTTSNAYQPLINALAANFNTIAVHYRPGPTPKSPIVVNLFPEISGLKISSSALTSSPGKKDKVEINTTLDSGITLVTITGSAGTDAAGSYAFRKLWQTWEAFGGTLLPLFARRGIAFNGRLVHGRVPPRIAAKPPFYEFESEPLSISIDRMFKYSSNFTAEMLFKTLSAQRDSVQGSWERSAAFVKSWWKERGLPGTPLIQNGSGLGNTNRMSPAQIVALLSHVWKQKAYLPDYCAALSTAGLDGTLKSRFVKSPLKGLVRAKTGTLNLYGINTLAGYLLLPDAAPYAFAIFCTKTGHTQYEDWVMQEQLLEKVAECVIRKAK